MQYLPPLSHWLLPCRRLQRLEVTGPDLRLAPHLLAQLPALQHLYLETNVVKNSAMYVLELEHLEPAMLPTPLRLSLPAVDNTPSPPRCSPARWRRCRACAA